MKEITTWKGEKMIRLIKFIIEAITDDPIPNLVLPVIASVLTYTALSLLRWIL